MRPRRHPERRARAADRHRSRQLHRLRLEERRGRPPPARGLERRVASFARSRPTIRSRVDGPDRQRPRRSDRRARRHPPGQPLPREARAFSSKAVRPFLSCAPRAETAATFWTSERAGPTFRSISSPRRSAPWPRGSGSSPSIATPSPSTTRDDKTAGTPEIEVLAADAFELPFPPGFVRPRDRVDVPPPLRRRRRGAPASRASGDLAKRAVLINDLRRHRRLLGLHLACRPHHAAAPDVRARCGALRSCAGSPKAELSHDRARRRSTVRQGERPPPLPALARRCPRSPGAMTRTELLVIGGGPAGAALAALAAGRGVKTLVIEQDRFPRDKVCGEFVSAEGCAVLSRLGVLQARSRREGAMPMDALPSGRREGPVRRSDAFPTCRAPDGRPTASRGRCSTKLLLRHAASTARDRARRVDRHRARADRRTRDRNHGTPDEQLGEAWRRSRPSWSWRPTGAARCCSACSTPRSGTRSKPRADPGSGSRLTSPIAREARSAHRALRVRWRIRAAWGRSRAAGLTSR